MTSLSSESEWTLPVGFEGEFIQANSEAGHAEGESATGNPIAPARIAPTLYVGYATSGKITLLISRSVGSQATNSFDPIKGKTSKSPLAPRFAIAQFFIASLS
ncbi:unannotated protein [freshwater metagenome]|uniref:Unannotated protein n=1 Tax=freshwater metagenome TaxID=449393 RepID=A0A6J6XJ65_9ZZZZ